MKKKGIEVTIDLSTKQWLNLEEAITYIGFGCKTTFQKLRDTNKLPFSKLGKNIIYRRSDLDKLLENNMIFPHKL